MILVKQSEATAAYRRMCFQCVDATDGMTPETGEAGGQPQISTNGGAWANTTNTLVAIGNGRYYVELTAAELGTIGIIEGRYKSANTAEALGTTLQIVRWNPYDVTEHLGVAYCTVETGSSSTVIEIGAMVPAYRDAAATVGAFVNGIMFFLDGVNAGEVQRISQFTGEGSGHWDITVDSAFTFAPNDGDHCVIMPFAAGTQLNSILADVTGLNGDAMRGTDSAALASVCTETRLAELDAANMPTDLDGVKTKTDSLTFTTANKVDSRVDYMGATGVTGPSDLKADVTNLDAAVSSRSSHSAADAADAVWDEAIAGHTTGTTFGGKNQKVVPSETINDYKADVSALALEAGGNLAAVKAKTDNLPSSPAAVGSAMTLADDAITAAKYDESTAFPVKSADTGATQIARVGADGDTLETLSDQIDGVGSSGDVTSIKGTALTETNAGDLANNISQFFDVNPTTTKDVDDVGSVASGGVPRLE